MLNSPFLLSKQDSLYNVSITDISYLKTEIRYTTVYSTKGKFLTQLSLTKWRQLLPHQEFIQINRSTLIKINCIEQITLKDNLLILADKSMHIIGRQYKLTLLELFKKVI